MPTLPTDPNIVHQKAFVVRKRTKTREPIYIMVTQWQNENKELTIPTIEIVGMKDTAFESIRFIRDFGAKLFEAAGFADERATFVNGMKR